MLSFATFAVGFVVRPVGGFVFGNIADRIGCKRALALTMFLIGTGSQPTRSRCSAGSQGDRGAAVQFDDPFGQASPPHLLDEVRQR